jgi:hypothetical protein
MALFDALGFVFAIVMYVWLWHLFKDLRTQRFRHALFVLRKEMFEFAAGGDISFTDPAFMIAWARVNSLIRYAHRLTLSYVVAMVRVLNDRSVEAIHHWERALDDVPNHAARERLLDFHINRVALLCDHINRGSLTIWMIDFLIHVASFVHRRGARLRIVYSRIYFKLSRVDAVSGDEHPALA